MDNLQEFIKLARAFFAVRRHKHSKRELPKMPGWVKLGDGLYGEAWNHPAHPDLVLKISGPSQWGWDKPRNDEPDMDGWPVFAQHCLTHKDEHLPNVMHFEQATPGMCWAVMPRYTRPWYCMGDFPYDLREVVSFIGGHRADGPDWAWPLRRMASALNLQEDIHSGNVMWCSMRDTWVITDPFST